MGGMPPEGPRQGHTGTASDRGTRPVTGGAPSKARWLSGSTAGPTFDRKRPAESGGPLGVES